MVTALGAQSFVAGLRPPAGRTAVPVFDDGWIGDGGREPFLAYASDAGVRWSAELEELHAEASRDHFIDRWTRAAILERIEGEVPLGATIADLGCSTGYLLEDLRAARPDAFLVGVDLVAEGLRKAHRSVPSAALVLADACDLPFGDETVDAVTSANLLEHVPDDERALAEIQRVLRPAGRAVLVVPAGAGLYDYYDEFLGHERRYRRGELAAKARGAGLDVIAERFLASLLHPTFWLTKKWHRLRPPPDVAAQVERDIRRTRDSRVGSLAVRLDRRLGLPFGIRNLTVLRKP